MQHTRIYVLVNFLVLSLLASGCGGAPTAREGPIKAVATFSVLADLVHNVAGELAQVTSLVRPGADAHTFEPSPADGVVLAKADIVFENGIQFETWLNRMYKASRNRAPRVVVTKNLALIEGGDCCKHGHHAHDHKHNHESLDPHVWHDVKNVMAMVEVIRDRLVEVDPANAAHYSANADAYLEKLRKLDAWVVETVAAIPEERRRLITSHDTFGYFAKRYGFEVVGTALGSVSTEASDPSAGDFAKLVTAIKDAKVPAIFAENVQNARLMERLAKEAGVKVAPPLLTDALADPGQIGDTYETMMRYNVSTMVEALRP